MELDELRHKIDGIDKELTALFAERMELSEMIAQLKRDNGLKVFDAGREAAVRERIASMLPEDLRHSGERLYSCIFELSRSRQRRIAGSFGLLGGKLGHSYSPLIHSFFGSYDYKAYEKSPDELEDFLMHGDFDGLNVTIPYKKAVLPYCSELSETARTLGSVNTIVRRADGSLYGDNTDYDGFNYLVGKSGIDMRAKKALVLGNGGAAVTVCAVLRALGAFVTVISRRGEDNYENLYRHADAEIIVNTTPLGMYPNTGTAAVDLSVFPRCEAVFDIVYNPARTALMLQAEALGIPSYGGLYMLVAQAKRASEIFCESSIPDSEIERIYARLCCDTQNIVLIGMPGCGKSTVAVMLGDALGRSVLDADGLIEDSTEASIADIFNRDGEEAFRALESKLLREIGKRSGAIIATGGGCVTRELNYPSLHQNAVIYYLMRDTSKLARNGRPISLSRDLDELYAERAPLYERWADFRIDNNGTLDDTVQAILETMK